MEMYRALSTKYIICHIDIQTVTALGRPDANTHRETNINTNPNPSNAITHFRNSK